MVFVCDLIEDAVCPFKCPLGGGLTGCKCTVGDTCDTWFWVIIAVLIIVLICVGGCYCLSWIIGIRIPYDQLKEAKQRSLNTELIRFQLQEQARIDNIKWDDSSVLHLIGKRIELAHKSGIDIKRQLHNDPLKLIALSLYLKRPRLVPQIYAMWKRDQNMEYDHKYFIVNPEGDHEVFMINESDYNNDDLATPYIRKTPYFKSHSTKQMQFHSVIVKFKSKQVHDEDLYIDSKELNFLSNEPVALSHQQIPLNTSNESEINTSQDSRENEDSLFDDLIDNSETTPLTGAANIRNRPSKISSWFSFGRKKKDEDGIELSQITDEVIQSYQNITEMGRGCNLVKFAIQNNIIMTSDFLEWKEYPEIEEYALRCREVFRNNSSAAEKKAAKLRLWKVAKRNLNKYSIGYTTMLSKATKAVIQRQKEIGNKIVDQQNRIIKIALDTSQIYYWQEVKFIFFTRDNKSFTVIFFDAMKNLYDEIAIDISEDKEKSE